MIRPLDQVTRELVTWWEPALPAEHVCRAGCQHGNQRGRPMLDRVADLRQPSKSLARQESAGKLRRARAGSPAPWWAPAAELVDQVLRAAIADLRALHRVQGLPEPRMKVRRDRDPRQAGPVCARPDRCGHDSCRPWTLVSCRVHNVDVDVAGRWAIRHLAPIIASTEGRAPADPIRAAAAEAETRLRRAAARCETILGVREPSPRLDRMTNADYRRFVGPHCPPPELAPWQPPECTHATCRRAWAAQHVQRAVPWCLHCGEVGMRIDPVAAVVWCPTRGCTAADGTRSRWTLEELATWWTS